jgi:hypothetical protein
LASCSRSRSRWRGRSRLRQSSPRTGPPQSRRGRTGTGRATGTGNATEVRRLHSWVPSCRRRRPCCSLLLCLRCLRRRRRHFHLLRRRRRRELGLVLELLLFAVVRRLRRPGGWRCTMQGGTRNHGSGEIVQCKEGDRTLQNIPFAFSSLPSSLPTCTPVHLSPLTCDEKV